MTTYNLPALRDLLVRVEAATGPDLELDGRIWCLRSGLTFYRWDGAGVVWKCADGTIRHSGSERISRYTASIDAAVALIERVLPHSLISLSNDHTEGWTAKVRLSYGKRMATPALALLSALMKALIAREEQNEQG